MRRRAVFVDVDGTLVGHDGVAPDSAVDAIRAARAAGHLVFVCTGRSRAEMWPDLLDIGFDGVVGASGAFAEVGGEIIVHRGIPDADLRRALDHFAALGTEVLLQADRSISTSAALRERLQDLFAAMTTDTAAFERGSFGFINRIRVGLPEDEPIMKVVYIGCPTPIEELRATLGGAFDIVPSSVVAFGPGSGEVTAAGIDKAAGLDAVVAHLGLAHADTIALGDSHNDLEMLRHAAVGIAMGNAVDEVKAVADEVTGTVAEGGLRAAFLRHGLIEA